MAPRRPMVTTTGSWRPATAVVKAHGRPIGVGPVHACPTPRRCPTAYVASVGVSGTDEQSFGPLPWEPTERSLSLPPPPLLQRQE